MAPLRIRTINLSFILKCLGVLLLIAFIAWYGWFQAESFIRGPQITLEEPHATAQTQSTIVVRGHAENITLLTLNGRTIHTDEWGNFAALLVLPPGYTIMTLRAEDRYGRTTSLSRELTYTPQDLPVNEIQNANQEETFEETS